MITLIRIFVVLLIIYVVRLSRRHSQFPPGPPRLPIWGSYWYLLKEDYNFAHKAIDKLAKKYNTELLGFYLGNNPCVFATSNETCRIILTREEFKGRVDGFIFRSRSFGKIFGVFFKDGYFWKEQRRFSLRALRDCGFGRRFEATEEIFANQIAEVIKLCNNTNNRYSRNGQILLPDVFYVPVLNSILYILIGRTFESHEVEELAQTTVKFLSCFNATGCAISITPWLKYIAPNFFSVKEICESNRHLFDFFAKEAQQRKLSFAETYKTDFLDMYLNKINSEYKNKVDNSNFTEFQMLWVLIDYLFPTPSSIPFALSYIWLYLCIYPKVQRNIQEEIDRVIGRSRTPNLNDRSKMNYTEAVIRETLRKHPLLVISTPRRCTEDTTINGYFIPKNTAMFPCQWSANHDPKIWNEPEKFKPERFLDKNGILIKKDYTIAFGGGKRVCPGETFSKQLLFLFLTGLLQKFNFKPVGKIPDPTDIKGGFIVHMGEFSVEAIRC